MKIVVVSDTHGSLRSWQKVAGNFLPGAGLVIHAGDVLYHGPRNPMPEGYNPARVADEINQSTCPVIIARGNCDAEVDQAVLQWPLLSPCVLYQAAGIRFLVHHGHLWDQEEALLTCNRYRIDLCISGHTHVPSLGKAGGVLLLNPGSTSLPKDEQRIPTIALIEDRTARVVELESGKVVMEEAMGVRQPVPQEYKMT